MGHHPSHVIFDLLPLFLICSLASQWLVASGTMLAKILEIFQNLYRYCLFATQNQKCFLKKFSNLKVYVWKDLKIITKWCFRLLAKRFPNANLCIISGVQLCGIRGSTTTCNLLAEFARRKARWVYSTNFNCTISCCFTAGLVMNAPQIGALCLFRLVASFNLQYVSLEPSPKPPFLANATYEVVEQFMGLFQIPFIDAKRKVTNHRSSLRLQSVQISHRITQGKKFAIYG